MEVVSNDVGLESGLDPPSGRCLLCRDVGCEKTSFRKYPFFSVLFRDCSAVLYYIYAPLLTLNQKLTAGCFRLFAFSLASNAVLSKF